ncbi:MAG: enolase C-terminal domain-like protein [Candidatus Pacearchaeota archaeon]
MKPANIKASQVYDSRGKPTIKVTIVFSGGEVFAIAPNGTSTGRKEVRDFSIKGIEYSLILIDKIGEELKNVNLESFESLQKVEDIVKKYDNTQDYRILGGNALYALEAALIKAIAKSQGLEPWRLLRESEKIRLKLRMPMPLGNCIGGGKHSTIVGSPEFQEFLITPITKKFFEACFINMHAYKKAKELLQRLNKLKGITIENALCGTFSNEEAIDFLIEVRENIKETFGIELDIGIDVAATSFFKANTYQYKTKPLSLSASSQLEFIKQLIKKHNLVYVEDPFYEDDFESFARLTSQVSNCLVVGDDLTCTNPTYIEKAIKMRAINGVIIKPNQIGSLLTTKYTFDLAKKAGIKCIVSHRSGDTIDDFIADLAVGWQADFIKAGITGREREAKLKRIIAIEKSLIG